MTMHTKEPYITAEILDLPEGSAIKFTNHHKKEISLYPKDYPQVSKSIYTKQYADNLKSDDTLWREKTGGEWID